MKCLKSFVFFKRPLFALLYKQRMGVHTHRDVLELSGRGLFKSTLPNLESDQFSSHLKESPRCVYCGIDPTASSLTIGNLLSLIGLMYCQAAGHQPLVLIGNATAFIGDPSGMLKERSQMTADQVNKNTASMQKTIQRIFDNFQQQFGASINNDLRPLQFVYNADWYSKMNILTFFTEIAHKFRITTMLRRKTIELRIDLGEGLNLSEFSYLLFQAYDFMHLHQNHSCTVQLGGGDQEGNIMDGINLIRHTIGKACYGIVTPLLLTPSGEKIGKSTSRGVTTWLDSELTTPFDFYQFFMRLPDASTELYLKLLTFLPDEEIHEIMKKQLGNTAARCAQKRIAEEVTRLVHGEEDLKYAQLTSNILYDFNLETLSSLSKFEMKKVLSNANVVHLNFFPNMTVTDLGLQIGCFLHIKTAHRIIQAGGCSINFRKYTDPLQLLIPEDIVLPNGITLLRIGRKSYHIIFWAS